MNIIVPDHTMRPSKNVTKYEVKHSSSFTEWAWKNFPFGSSVNLKNYHLATNLSKCAADYMIWYLHHSHPRLLRDTSRSYGGPDRSATKHWVGLWMHATQPFLQYRDQMPATACKLACDEVDRLVVMWNTALGNQEEEEEEEEEEKEEEEE